MGELEINYFEFRFNYLECNFFLLMFFHSDLDSKELDFPIFIHLSHRTSPSDVLSRHIDVV